MLAKFSVFANGISAARFNASPILRNPQSKQTRIGGEDVGRQTDIVGVQKRARDGRRVEDVFHIGHRMPLILIGKDQRRV